jgi:serine/threonine protein kinase
LPLVSICAVFHLLLIFLTCTCDCGHAFILVRLSEDGGDLLKWMLSPNPLDRPTLAQVMLHEWVVRGEVRPPT